MKKILITGINGFIGSNCKKFFENKGFEVYGLDLAGVSSKNILIGEVDKKNLETFSQTFDFIIHLAGSGTVSNAQKSPEIEYAKSVLSLKHLLDYCVEKNKNTKIIFSSSAAVYGNKFNTPIKEAFELNPISVYGKHKVEAEKLLKEYYENFGIKSNIIRFFSIYGEGLRKQLLWDFSNRLKNLDGNRINCYGNGQEKRDFVHIEDCVSLIYILINADIDFDIFNCASGQEMEIDFILKLLCKKYKLTPEFVYDNIEREGDPVYLCANIDKAANIGFSPKTSIEVGLERYARWFKNN